MEQSYPFLTPIPNDNYGRSSPVVFPASPMEIYGPAFPLTSQFVSQTILQAFDPSPCLEDFVGYN